jgi:hypothetical protein
MEKRRMRAESKEGEKANSKNNGEWMETENERDQVAEQKWRNQRRERERKRSNIHMYKP